MNKITRLGLRTVRRNPGRALRLALFAAKHRKALGRTLRATRRTSALMSALREGAAHPMLRVEAKAAGSALAQAGREARRAGATNAFRDDEVTTQLRKAKRHARNAAATARRPPPKHSAFTRATGSMAAVAFAGALSVAWRRSQAGKSDGVTKD
jgi:hypothetical protein